MNCEHYLVKNTNLEAYGLSITGQVRKANEDSCGFATVPNGELFVVCDGMGGHVGGATASRIAVEQIIQHFKAQLYPNVYQALNDALCRANIQILGAAAAEPSLKGMGTTACIVLVNGNDAYIAHVGDSRIYLFEAQKQCLFRITKDHSFVQSLVDMGQLDDRDAEHHPRKNVIMKALGIKEDLHPEVFMSPVQPAKGDMFLICSDGLSGMVDDNGIEAILASDQSTEQKVLDVVTNANVPGKGLDNITAQVIKVIESPYPVSNHPDHNPKWRKGPDTVPTREQKKNLSQQGNAQGTSSKKKAKTLLFILIPVVVLLMLIGGGVGAYFIWWHGKDRVKEQPKTEFDTFEKPGQSDVKNNGSARLLEEQEKANRELENEKNALNAEKEAAIRAKAEAEKEKEQAQKEADKAKKEADKAKAEVQKMRKEEKAKAEKQAQEQAEQKAKEEAEKAKKVEVEKVGKAKELKSAYDALLDQIAKLDANDAKKVCKALGMNDAASSAWAKNELVEEAKKAYNAENSARLAEMEKAIKNKK